MWPVNHHFELTEEQVSLEKRKTNIFVVVENSGNFENVILELMEKHSSYNKILRIMSYILRFIEFCKKK